MPRSQLQAPRTTPANFVLCNHTIYYPPRDEQAQALGVPLPRSTRTIWKILRKHGRIALDLPRRRQSLERPAPLHEVQMDFKDESLVPAEPGGKQHHVVETLNFVDAGTSIPRITPK